MRLGFNAKKIYWFLIIQTLAFSFPLQVLTHSVYPSLLPYILGSVVAGISCLSVGRVRIGSATLIDKGVLIYVVVVITHGISQMLFLEVPAYSVAASFVNFLFPILFYVYFRYLASSQDFQTVFFAIAIAGFIIGIYFVYDTYLKVGLGHVSTYSKEALQYTLGSHTNKGGANLYRTRLGGRSFGLLETHTVSGAWIVMGMIASLACERRGLLKSPRIIILTFSVMSLIGMNYTNILALGFILVFIYFRVSGVQMAAGLIARIRNHFITISLIAVTVIFAAIYLAGYKFLSYIITMLLSQSDLIFGTGLKRTSYLLITHDYILRYLDYLVSDPLAFFLGDGFTYIGMPKGGDVGWLETLARFGVPIYLLLFFGIMSVLKKALGILRFGGLHYYGKTKKFIGRALEFAVAIIILILVNEIHYSAYTSKSVFPIVFIAFAALSKYGAIKQRSSQRVCHAN
ncbi:MAG: hypothetical protein P1U63_02785 [Coxiellaceae bacterium]|nr:hypothetical protein [Coxiellaceae bacterium]